MKLGDVCTIRYGKDHKKLADGQVPVYGSGGVMRHVEQPIYDKPSVLIPRKGTLGNLFYAEKPFWTVDTLFWTEIDESKVIPRYLYYTLKTKNLAELNVGTAVPSLTTDVLNEVEVNIPGLETQERAVQVLETVDEAISLNHRTNDYLLALAEARFEAKLNNAKTSIRLGDIVELEDSKRIPLNSRDRERCKGPYPYYGATGIMDYVNDYLFDGIRILLGEDGTVIDEGGRPILQYVWGKYWVNNHAHILKAATDYSLEALYIALRRTSVNRIVTGAVQMKISQRNLRDLNIDLPSADSLDFLQDIFAEYRSNVEESKCLTALRNTLLPKLMSGEIDVSKVELPTPPNNHLCAD